MSVCLTSDVNTSPASLPTKIQVTVVTFRHGCVWQRQILLPADSTASQAIEESGYLIDFPDESISDIVMGVFGKRVVGAQRLMNHDRVEVYAPLTVEPKIARRRRAAHREKVKNIKKKMPVDDLTQS